MAPKINILVVDDEQHNLNSFKATFRTKYNVITALSGDEAIKILDENYIQIIFTDQRMPNMTGVEFLASILKDHPLPMRVLLTGYADFEALENAVNNGKIHGFLGKPWSEEKIDAKVDEMMAIYNERMEEIEKTETLAVSNKQLEFLLRQKLLS